MVKFSQLIPSEEKPRFFSRDDFPNVDFGSGSLSCALVGMGEYKLDQSSEIIDKEDNYKVYDYNYDGEEYKLVTYTIEKPSDSCCDFTFETNKEPLCYFISSNLDPFVTLSKEDLASINYKNPISITFSRNVYFRVGVIYKNEDFNEDVKVSMKFLAIFYDHYYRQKILNTLNLETEIQLENKDFFTKKRLDCYYKNHDDQKVYIKLSYDQEFCNLFKCAQTIQWTDGWIIDPPPIVIG